MEGSEGHVFSFYTVTFWSTSFWLDLVRFQSRAYSSIPNSSPYFQTVYFIERCKLFIASVDGEADSLPAISVVNLFIIFLKKSCDHGNVDWMP